MTTVVRPARQSDLDAIATVFLHCWQQSYAAFLPPDVIELYDARGARQLWERHLHPDVAPGLVVAEHRSTGSDAPDALGTGAELVTGVALVEPSEGYLASLYVDPRRQGTGAGRLLLTRGTQLCRAAGCRHMRWWVFETNATARRFYASLGASLTGRQRVEPEYGITELELGMPL